MNKPSTEYVLIRTPRPSVILRILSNFGGDFDFSDYSFLKIMVTDRGEELEEWVPTSELELYKRVMLNQNETKI